jgi:hypothetical protein
VARVRALGQPRVTLRALAVVMRSSRDATRSGEAAATAAWMGPLLSKAWALQRGGGGGDGGAWWVEGRTSGWHP